MKKPCNNCEYALEYKTRKCTRYQPHNFEMCRKCEAYQKYEDYLKSKQQYRCGNTLTTMQALEDFISENQFVYIRGKIYHIGWVMSLQYMTIRRYIKSGVVKEAIRK